MSNLGDPELINQLNELSIQLPQAIKLMGKYGRDYAKADVEYRQAKAQEVVRLRINGESVTLIGDLVYNSEDVSNALYNRDQSEALYKTAQENINAIKIQIRVIEDQISREWAE